MSKDKSIDLDFLRNFSKSYIDKNIEVIRKLDIDKIIEVSALLFETKEMGKNIFFCGNGGSMSIATHLACDFGKGTKFSPYKKHYKTISLDNIAWLTAQANDGKDPFIDGNYVGTYNHGYDGAFVGQLENFIEEADVLFAISSSGQSQNILNVLEFAKLKKAKTVAMVGFDGGRALEIADYTILVPSEKGEYGIVEGIHEIIHHLLYEAAREMEKRQ